ncbi:hypothetical protein GPECTOR_1g609 [Gonium pectorale]|uniref:RNA polymerase II-associated protein 1 N-terminal domain-containing protein n=1 Tax=Gonium pectorale TaxID=33097 RepID=A0A150H3C3_GONPE|nr:hypothetical protein GPECTOR_1g609 [Gonium pectorale]|eukprot:KXZ56676.1 hypothetical protein GPECTOR_1g609 [Gonium pectorale]
MAASADAGLGGPDGSVRGDEDLFIDTEEDLLRMQQHDRVLVADFQFSEEFMAQHSQPAAKVTRIGSAAAASGASASAPRSSSPKTSRGQPAAPVTSWPVADPTERAADPDAPDAATEPHQERSSILEPIPGLLGNIVERPTAPPGPPPGAVAAGVVGPPVVRDVVAPFPDAELPSSSAAAAPFPEATHRRQSKFALSRKAKLHQGSQPEGAVGSGPGPSGPSVPPRPSAGSRPAAAAAGSGALSSWSIQPTAPTTAAGCVPTSAAPPALPADELAAALAAAPGRLGRRAGDGGGDGGDAQVAGQLGSIGERNAEAVARMTPDEVAAALEELSSRISPGAMEFLRKRGAQRLKHQQQTGASASGPAAAAAAAAAGVAGLGMAPLGALPRGAGGASFAADPEVPASCSTQEDGNALIDGALRALTSNGGKAGTGQGLPASVAAPGSAVGSISLGALAAAQQRQREQQQAEGEQRAHAHRGGEPGTTAGAEAGGVPQPRGSPADPRLVARLRFDVDGSVVDVQAPEDMFVEEEVLLRDQLRRDEGSAPPGYTLGELLVLCRSAVAAQRTAGLSCLAGLMASARPRPEDLSMHAPPSVVERVDAEVPAHSVSWQEVWQFAVSELGLVAHLRLALDDERPAVVAAAATALASVVRAHLV